MPEIIARVRGSLRIIVEPTPTSDSTVIEPRNLATLVLTTSIPTPLPDTLVTTSAVEKPGWKIKL